MPFPYIIDQEELVQLDVRLQSRIIDKRHEAIAHFQEGLMNAQAETADLTAQFELAKIAFSKAQLDRDYVENMDLHYRTLLLKVNKSKVEQAELVKLTRIIAEHKAIEERQAKKLSHAEYRLKHNAEIIAKASLSIREVEATIPVSMKSLQAYKDNVDSIIFIKKSLDAEQVQLTELLKTSNDLKTHISRIQSGINNLLHDSLAHNNAEISLAEKKAELAQCDLNIKRLQFTIKKQVADLASLRQMQKDRKFESSLVIDASSRKRKGSMFDPALAGQASLLGDALRNVQFNGEVIDEHTTLKTLRAQLRLLNLSYENIDLLFRHYSQMPSDMMNQIFCGLDNHFSPPQRGYFTQKFIQEDNTLFFEAEVNKFAFFTRADAGVGNALTDSFDASFKIRYEVTPVGFVLLNCQTDSLLLYDFLIGKTKALEEIKQLLINKKVAEEEVVELKSALVFVNEAANAELATIAEELTQLIARHSPDTASRPLLLLDKAVFVPDPDDSNSYRFVITRSEQKKFDFSNLLSDFNKAKFKSNAKFQVLVKRYQVIDCILQLCVQERINSWFAVNSMFPKPDPVGQLLQKLQAAIADAQNVYTRYGQTRFVPKRLLDDIPKALFRQSDYSQQMSNRLIPSAFFQQTPAQSQKSTSVTPPKYGNL
jgi:hypothetical protein